VTILLWIVRILVILLLIRLIVRFISMARAPARKSARRGGMERAGGELVQDPQCGTYVPKARAIVSGTGDGAKYFCSTTCRDAYAQR
jgi:uncharacterized protein